MWEEAPLFSAYQRTPQKAFLYPVHLAMIATGNWSFRWDPKTVDAATSDRAYSIDRARKELGHSPTYPLEDDLRETVDWYRQNGLIEQASNRSFRSCPLWRVMSQMWSISEPGRDRSGLV
jgi:hypothetical protein